MNWKLLYINIVILGLLVDIFATTLLCQIKVT